MHVNDLGKAQKLANEYANVCDFRDRLSPDHVVALSTGSAELEIPNEMVPGIINAIESHIAGELNKLGVSVAPQTAGRAA